MFDPDEEPDGDVSAPHHLWIGLAVTAFSFGSVWRYHRRLGSIGTLLGLLIALDDAIEHTFNVRTPLDELWARVLHPLVKRIENRRE